jgi:hypothetical protein
MELVSEFARRGGQSYLGHSAWEHLESLAGPSMTRFLEKYVRSPMDDILNETSPDLPDLCARLVGDEVKLSLGNEEIVITRRLDPTFEVSDGDAIPEDIVDEFAG